MTGSKGKFDGTCNRTACNNSHKVTWYNHATNKYYCQACAKEINKYSISNIYMKGVCENMGTKGNLI